MKLSSSDAFTRIRILYVGGRGQEKMTSVEKELKVILTFE